MKRFVLLFFALLGYSLHATGQEQRIAGFIYATDPTEAIPFASLWLYDPATGEPEYGTLTSVNGYYELDAIATNRTYRLEISGPGIQPQTRQIEIAYVPGIEGRRYFHFPVIRSQKDLATVQPVETYLPKQIAPDARTIEDLYSHIPGITLSDRRKRWYGMSYVQRTYPNKSDGIRDTHECIDCSQRNTYRILSVRLCGNSLL